MKSLNIFQNRKLLTKETIYYYPRVVTIGIIHPPFSQLFRILNFNNPSFVYTVFKANLHVIVFLFKMFVLFNL